MDRSLFSESLVIAVCFDEEGDCRIRLIGLGFRV